MDIPNVDPGPSWCVVSGFTCRTVPDPSISGSVSYTHLDEGVIDQELSLG